MPSRRTEWMVAGVLAGWAAARLTGADRLRLAETWTVPVLSFTPQVTAAAWAGALLLPGAGPAATAAVAGAALTVAVGPRVLAHRQPLAAGPVLRVLTANLLAGRAAAGGVVDLVRRTRADVLFVQEVTDGATARLRQAGLGDLLPYPAPRPAPRGTQDRIYARYPLRGEPHDSSVRAARSTARLDLPSGPSVQLTCIHAVPPRPARRPPGPAARWRTELAALPAPGDGPCILAGDFNATLDHAQFRRLLRRGYADAAREAGHGLSLTWGPRPGQGPALLAIDHVLTDRRCAVLATSTYRLPGSDHRALYAELRLPEP